MQLQVLQEDLSKALSLSIRFVSNRNTLEVLGNFLLTAEKSKLKIQATNLEMSISLSIGAKIEKEGEVTVAAKTFLEIISNLNKGQLSLNLEKEQLKIESVGFSGNIPTAPANDFPKIPQALDSKKSFTIPSNILTKALARVLFSSSSDETRPILTGVLFIASNAPKATNSSILNLVSSDGFRLSKKQITIKEELKMKNIVVPKNALLELIKIAAMGNEVFFELKESDNQLVIKVNDIIISTRLIEGSFPDFEKIIPSASSTSVKVDREDLSRAVKLSSVFAREEGNVIKLKIKENSVELESESAKVGKQSNTIEANVEGSASTENPLIISFNYKFIEEFLNGVEDNIEIKLTDGISPAIFVDPKDADFLHLIMPVRIQG